MAVTLALNADEIISVLRSSGLSLQETITLPGREAHHLPVPEGLHQKLDAELKRRYPEGLYSHQSNAIRMLLDGSDVCLATPTASGKSLVFMALAAELTLRGRFAKVLALYPAKALIQDQIAKWQAFMEPFGVRVGFIDGSVAVSERERILTSCRIVAMTPDVAHAWLMSRLAKREVADFLNKLCLLVLDEAHVYDGAFGTNMAYFLRRLNIGTKPFQVICSTATVGEPDRFMLQLTGREMRVLDADADGSKLSVKTLLLSPTDPKGSFDRMVQLLKNLAAYGKARFLAFGDSRKAVERVVAAILRQEKDPVPEDPAGTDEEDDDAQKEPETWPKLEHVLPFRAGYENDDRTAIQKALTEGSLAGVVSTSALELGLDIGDLDIVVLLNTPPSAKAFRQRIGRAGRRHPSVCILLDDQGVIAPLGEYVARKPEPSWLYLENRYIQYANALCAAAELQARGITSAAGVAFPGLPESFGRLVENELNPTEAVPPDLYGLKQKAQGNPHYEFPIRSAAEPNFSVEGPFGYKLGTLSYAQALREAYPGAVYYYMARPFRVFSLEFKKGKIKAKRTKYFTTKALADNIAFPNFKSGLIASWKSPVGFVCEVELQVSERVKGFVEQRGQTKTAHEYGPTSIYSQKPLTRFFQTTGVCWAFPGEITPSQAAAERVLRAFSLTCGIQERDLGLAFFKANEGPFDPTPVAGTVIFDATNGSLRLTERLGVRFQDVVAAAIAQTDEKPVKDALDALDKQLKSLQSHTVAPDAQVPGAEGDWVQLIARNQPAMYMHSDGPIEVTVLDYRYTPSGIMYELQNLKGPGFQLVNKDIVPAAPIKWMVLAAHIQPTHGVTKMVRYNLVTGEEAPVGSPAA
jgi:DEAD/DEAH box helicase domain-containing protein